MLRGVVICPDIELRAALEATLADLGQGLVVRVLDEYPDQERLLRVMRAHAPNIVLLDVDALDRALEAASWLEQAFPNVRMVALGRSTGPEVLLRLMRSGLRECLTFPWEPQQLADVLDRLRRLVETKPPVFVATKRVFSFLPAKAGAGASTLALHTSVALSKIPDGSRKRARRAGTRVLLSDLDLNSGTLSMLAPEYTGSLLDAAKSALDEEIWPKLVRRVGSLDTLAAGPLNATVRIDAAAIRRMLEFARRHYEIICLDLSGMMEEFSLAAMQESARILLVCTSELPALHLAREKLTFLRARGLENRVSVVLNRFHSRAVITRAEVEQVVGLPVAHILPNDYAQVQQNLLSGAPIDPDSDLGSEINRLAGWLLKEDTTRRVDPPRRFVEFFTMSPGRYTLVPGGE